MGQLEYSDKTNAMVFILAFETDREVQQMSRENLEKEIRRVAIIGLYVTEIFLIGKTAYDLYRLVTGLWRRWRGEG